MRAQVEGGSWGGARGKAGDCAVALGRSSVGEPLEMRPGVCPADGCRTSPESLLEEGFVEVGQVNL